MSVFSYQIPYNKRGRLSDAGRNRRSIPGSSGGSRKSPENPRVHNLSANDAKDGGLSNLSEGSKSKTKFGSRASEKKRQNQQQKSASSKSRAKTNKSKSTSSKVSSGSTSQKGKKSSASSKNKCCCKKAKRRFKNQKLPGWRPIYRKTWIQPILLVVGFSFLILAIALLVLATTVKEISMDYTGCSANITNGTGIKCKDHILGKSYDASNKTQRCVCKLNFTLDEEYEPDVKIFYGMRYFQRNHRRMLQSRDDNQLRGDDVTSPEKEKCYPLYSAYDPIAKKDLPIAPCGALANSMFNDTITLFYLRDQNNLNSSVSVPLKNTGICDPLEKEYMFKNPGGGPDLKTQFAGTTKPPYWQKYVYELDPNNSNNNGFKNEDLIVWMKVPNTDQFRNLHRLVDHGKGGTFGSKLPKGKYYFQIEYTYPVTAFGGRKLVVIQSGDSNILTYYNHIIGILFLLTGFLVLLASLVIFLVSKKYSKTQRILRRNPNPSELQAKNFNTIKNVMTNVKKN